MSLYAEDLYFLTFRAGWKVTKIYDHYTFRQDTFKKDFVVMNQNARKTAESTVERDFYKSLNNSNFGNDCRNNLENCKLELLYDGIDEIKYIKHFCSILKDQKFAEFFSLDLLKEQSLNEHKKRTEKLNTDDQLYDILKEQLDTMYDEEIESIEMYKKNRSKRRFHEQKHSINKIEKKIEDCSDLRKN